MLFNLSSGEGQARNFRVNAALFFFFSINKVKSLLGILNARICSLRPGPGGGNVAPGMAWPSLFYSYNLTQIILLLINII